MMKLLVAGDFCPRDRVSLKFKNKQYSEVLSEVKEIVSKHDYSIINEECPIMNKPAKPITKFCSNLSFSKEGLDALKYAGFDCLTLANNHFRDFGDDGVIQTLSREAGFDVVGGGICLKDAQKILYKTVKGIHVAIVNFCEHEFSIATDTSAGSAPLDLPDNYCQITEARANADFVVVIIHGGHEHYQLPSPRMKKTYRRFIDWGADVVVNHHQHCFSGYEQYNNKFIFYGLGNFCFDSPSSRKSIWNEGLLLSLIINDSLDYSFELIPYNQCDNQPSVKLLKDGEKENVIKKIQTLNAIISEDKELETEFDKHCKKRFEEMMLSLAPYSERIGKGLCRRGLLPSFNSFKRIVKTRNFVQCEAHRDVLNYYLDSMYQGYENKR